MGVLGVVLGICLSEAITFFRDQKRARGRAKGIRAVLSVEISKNRAELDKWLVAGGKLPVQSNQIWSSQLSSIPDAISADELRLVHTFYYDLYGLQKISPEKLRDAVEDFLKPRHPLE